MPITKATRNHGKPWREFGTGPDWSKGPLIGMDTETTSADPQTARIVTAAIVLDIPGSECQVWEWLSNPEVEIELGATAIHGINTETAREKGQDAREVIREILETLTGLWDKWRVPLVMVNAPFDLTIVRQGGIRLGVCDLGDIQLPPIIDTLSIDRMIDPYRRGRRTLTATAAAYNTTITGAHTAVGDIKCSITLARRIAQKYPRLATCNMEQLQTLQAEAHREWCQHYEDYRRIDNAGFTLGVNGWPWQMYL